MISSAHPAMNMLGPAVARSEADAAALVGSRDTPHRGRMPVALIPMEKEQLVRQMYAWGARNCEMHFCQVSRPFSALYRREHAQFLPETACESADLPTYR